MVLLPAVHAVRAAVEENRPVLHDCHEVPGYGSNNSLAIVEQFLTISSGILHLPWVHIAAVVTRQRCLSLFETFGIMGN